MLSGWGILGRIDWPVGGRGGCRDNLACPLYNSAAAISGAILGVSTLAGTDAGSNTVDRGVAGERGIAAAAAPAVAAQESSVRAAGAAASGKGGW